MKMPLKSLGRGVIIKNSGTFSVPNAAFTAITFDTVQKDDFGTAQTTKINIPSEGWYLFSGTITWDANTQNARATSIVINDTTTIGIIAIGANDGSAVADMNVTGAYYCQAGDYAKLTAFQNRTSGSLNLTASAFTALKLNSPVPFRHSRGIGAGITKSSFSPSNNTEQAVTFDTIFRDDFGTVNLASKNTVITIPKEGWYLFFAGGNWASNGTGERYITLKLNTSNYLEVQGVGVTGGVTNPNQNITAAYYCRAGDTIQLNAFQASGGSLALTSINLTAIHVG